MARWTYRCPKCKSITKTDYNRDYISKLKENLIHCPRCLCILKIKGDLTVTNFEEELIENSTKRKAESRLEGPETIEVLSL